MNYISQILGYIGGLLVISLNAPLLYETIKNKNSDNLSTTSLLLHLFTSFVYISYGALIKQWPVILCNISYSIMTLILIYLKYYYGNKINNKNQINENENI